MTAAATAALPFGRLADFKRTDQGLETLGEKFVHLGDNFGQLRSLKVALHQIDQVLHQQIALHLHDGGRCGTHKQHEEIVTRIATLLFVVFIKFGVVKRDFQRGAGTGEVVQGHAHFIQGLAEIILALDGPANLQNMVVSVKANTRFFLVKAVSAFAERACACVDPNRA